MYRVFFTATGGNGTCWGVARVWVARTGRAVDSNPLAPLAQDSLLLGG